jgi:hypothetical protein
MKNTDEYVDEEIIYDMPSEYLCNCPVHAQTMMTRPTAEQRAGIMVNDYRHWRASCGCNVIGNTIVESCVDCAAFWKDIK